MVSELEEAEEQVFAQRTFDVPPLLVVFICTHTAPRGSRLLL